MSSCMFTHMISNVSLLSMAVSINHHDCLLSDPKSGYYCHYKDGKHVVMNQGSSASKSEADTE